MAQQPPQGLFVFPGIKGIISAQYTLGHGISPGVCNMTVVPQIIREISGTLAITYQGVRLEFPGCLVDDIRFGVDGEGKQTQELTIVDRRWLWRDCGAISGYYNVRRGDNDIVPETKKNARELAALCLDAMNETGYNVNALPDNAIPEVEWEFDNPAEALTRLCESLGFRVVLQLNNKVRICKVGEGAALPVVRYTEGDISVNPPNPPEKVRLVCGRSRYQADFELFPVGLEADGTIKDIDQLSYAPKVQGKKTWRYSDLDHFQDIADRKFRRLAQQSVYRWYRIKTPFRLPGFPGLIQSLDRILPIEAVQVEKYVAFSFDNRVKREVARPAWVFGVFDGDEESHEPHEFDEVHDVVNKPKGLCMRGFGVDTELGIVKFSEPMFRYQRAPTGHLIVPAHIFLRTAVSVREEQTRAWIHAFDERKVPGQGRKGFIRYEKRDDIMRERYLDYSRGGVLVDNEAKVLAGTKHYLDGIMREYEVKEAGSIGWPGFRKQDVDGAIQQVSWILTGEGFAFTRASRNREEIIVTPLYKERRLIEKLAIAAAANERLAKNVAADAVKGKGT